MADVPQASWTGALVLTELRRALAWPAARPASRLTAALRPEDARLQPDVVQLMELYLGRDSLELRALLIVSIRRRDEISIREMCRERLGWRRSRTSLYRQARRGAPIMAERLNADGIGVPDQRSARSALTRRRCRATAPAPMR